MRDGDGSLRIGDCKNSRSLSNKVFSQLTVVDNRVFFKFKGAFFYPFLFLPITIQILRHEVYQLF